MKLTEIIALAKQGYKPSDIRELITIANESETMESVDSTEFVQNDSETATDHAGSDESSCADSTIDYKSLYESMQKELAQAKKSLETAQKINIKSDLSGKDNREADDDILNKLMRDFM